MKYRSMHQSMAIIMWLCVLSAVPAANAGSLEPSGPPASTMKSLDNVFPTWSRILPAAERFVVLADFNNEAVLDKETGLVWEKNPIAFKTEWVFAFAHCISEGYIGERFGWRLPTVEELASLLDHTQSNPSLPSGNPFTNVQLASGESYWTASTYPVDPTEARSIFFGGNGAINHNPKSYLNNFWCVRGGHGIDGGH